MLNCSKQSCTSVATPWEDSLVHLTSFGKTWSAPLAAKIASAKKNTVWNKTTKHHFPLKLQGKNCTWLNPMILPSSAIVITRLAMFCLPCDYFSGRSFQNRFFNPMWLRRYIPWEGQNLALFKGYRILEWRNHHLTATRSVFPRSRVVFEEVFEHWLHKNKQT